MTDFEALLNTLDANRVEYIVVDGAAALAHGSARFTQDLDVVYCRSSQNLDRLVTALRDFKPYLRGAPPGLPFVWDRTTLSHGLNFTLATSLGLIDLLARSPAAELMRTWRLPASSCRCLRESPSASVWNS